MSFPHYLTRLLVASSVFPAPFLKHSFSPVRKRLVVLLHPLLPFCLLSRVSQRIFFGREGIPHLSGLLVGLAVVQCGFSSPPSPSTHLPMTPGASSISVVF